MHLYKQKKQLEVFCKKGVLRIFAKFTGKHLWQRLLFNKVAGLWPPTLLQKSLWHRCFPVNLRNFYEHLFYRTAPDYCFSLKNLPFTRPHILKTMIFYSFFVKLCYAYIFSLQFFLFLKILHLVLYLANFIMIDLLLPSFLVPPGLCDRSVSCFLISSPIFSLIVSIASYPYFRFLIPGDLELASSSSSSTALVYLSYLLMILLLQTY